MKLSALAFNAFALLASVATTKAVMGVKGVADLNQRNLRDLDGVSAQCTYLCYNWLPGTCWYAYPKCYPKRRMLGATKDTVDKTLPANIKPVNSLMCAKAILVVEQKLEDLADIVKTEACKAALLDTKTFQCYMES
jgi:hypothetical protein